MPYLNETGLAYYNEKLQQWISSQPVKTIPSSLYPWTLTDKAGAVTCWPVGGTELKPTVDFLFTETGPASGDKGPDNPSTISGVSEVKVGRIGKNLLLKATPTYYPNPSPVTITQNADGTYTLNGTNNTNNIIYVAITDSAYVFSGSKSSVVLNSAKSYTISDTLISGSYTVGSTSATYLFGYSSNNGYYSSANFPLSGKTSFTLAPKPDADGKFIARMNISPGSTFASAVFAFQLEEGDTATDFEAPMLPADANHDIPLGGTYYGGTVDLATGVMTVTWAGFSLTGTESELYLYGNAGVDTRLAYNLIQAGFPLPYGGANDSVCSHSSSFDYNNTAAWGNYYVRANGFFVMQDKSNVIGTSIDNYRAWLASQYASGTPVSVAYKIATPYTVQLTPQQILSLAQQDKYTPRLNTVYTNASAVQVGYVKSPIRNEFKLKQAIVALGGNI